MSHRNNQFKKTPEKKMQQVEKHDTSKIKCFICQRTGHFAKDCTEKKPKTPYKGKKKFEKSTTTFAATKKLSEISKEEEGPPKQCNTMEINYIAYQQNHEKAKEPIRKTPGSAGLDLVPCESVVIKPGEIATIDTGIAIAIPQGTVGKIEIRTSVALLGLAIKAATIDSDYRGNIKMIIKNESKQPISYVAGGKAIAQLDIYTIITDHLKRVERLSTTERKGGFGSTDTKTISTMTNQPGKC